MADLREFLRHADHVPAPDLWSDIEGREPRQPGPSVVPRVAVAALALTVAAAGLALAAVAFLGPQREQRRSPTAPAVDVDPRITAELDVGRFPQEIAVGEGAVWVTSAEGQRWFVARIDPAANEVTDEIEVTEANDVAVGAGTVWVTGRDRELGPAVFRIDATSRATSATIPLDCGRCHADQIVADDEAVWLSASVDYPRSGQVIQIDASSNSVTTRTTLPGDPRDLVLGEGGVWVYSLTHFTKQSVAGGTIYRLDPMTGEMVATLLGGRVPPASGVNGPPVLAAGFGAMWTSAAPGRPIVLGSDRNGIVAIDAATNQISGELTPLSTLFFPFSVEEGGVWFRGGVEDAEPVISRLDPTTRTIEDTFSVDGTVLDGAIDPETHTMWLTTYQGSVLRVDLR
jgi:DNA-binding beta-propeller fold protein YncE